MIKVPEEIAAILHALGIVGPSSARWKKEHPCPISFERSGFKCDYGPEKWGHHVILSKATLKGKVVFIGQCDLCRTIHWRPALEDFMFAAGASPDMHRRN